MNTLRNFIGIVGLWALAAFGQYIESSGWVMQNSSNVNGQNGATLSSVSGNVTGWHKAGNFLTAVPGTVLQNLAADGTVANPDNDMNMTTMTDYALAGTTWWYRGTVNITFSAGQQVWLHFDGSNYHSDFYFNGHSLGSITGAFMRGVYNVTAYATSGVNYIAVLIHPNDNPGPAHTKQSGSCGQNGGTMTQDGPTFIASQGWDWIATIPDRDMGVWNKVYARVTGSVALRNPWIRTTNVSATSATVPLQVTLVNPTGTAVTGTLNADIDGTTQFTSATVTVPANGSATGTFPNLTMTNPKLWWPNGYGDPNLYTCTISFTPNGGTASDTTTFRFGVRSFSAQRGQACGLIVSCNGQRILCRGGSWGMDDQLKRMDLHKLENKVRYHKEMNFNMLRDWIGMTDNEWFYNFCDQYGIMIWSDFWQPHSADGPEPDSLTLFERTMLDKILRARNHASLVIWCERNETTPNQVMLDSLTSFHTHYDGTRIVQQSSGLEDCHSGGPWQWTQVSNCINVVYGFHTEIGTPTVPSYESVTKFLTTSGEQWPVANTYWSYHDYCSGGGSPSTYTSAMNSTWGTGSNLQDFCKKAQLMNIDEYRAYFESLESKRFSGAAGTLLWMSNCVWPSMMWQTYDYYMEGTGAVYGCQHGCEPVHVMYYGSNNIQVYNSTRTAISNYTVSAETRNLNGGQQWKNSQTISVGADASANAFAITAGTSTPYFLDLKLRDQAGTLVSKNFYWLPDDGSNISAMMSMAASTVAATGTATWTRSDTENTITLKIVNTGTVCDVACRLMLTGATSGNRILPCHYNDNYFSIVPGDTQNVTIKFDEVDRNNETPKLCLTGINVAQTCFTISGVTNARTDVVMGQKTSGLFADYSNGRIRIFNIPSLNAFTVRIFDMKGRLTMDIKGFTQGNFGAVPVEHLTPGSYIATVSTADQQMRTMVLVTGR
jgi:hypothetical protein